MSELVITMKMDGITGDSQVKGADGHADLVGFVYSATTPYESMGTGLAASGGASVTPVNVHKKVCSASPKLENQFFSGKPIGTVVLSEYKTDAQNQLSPWMVVTLTGAYLASYAVQPGAFESFELHFETIEREYFERSKDGALTSKGKTKFNVLTKEVS